MLCLTPYYVTLHCILKCFAATTENTIFTFEAWEIPVDGGVGSLFDCKNEIPGGRADTRQIAFRGGWP